MMYLTVLLAPIRGIKRMIFFRLRVLCLKDQPGFISCVLICCYVPHRCNTIYAYPGEYLDLSVGRG